MRLFCFVIALLPLTAFCQNSDKSKFAIEGTAAIQTGWWIYDKGTTDPAVSNNLGWDRTHHRPFFPFGLSLIYNISPVKFGVTFNYTLFINTVMLDFRDSDNLFRRYRISDGSVKLLKYGALMEVELVRKNNFSIAPTVNLGFFEIDTIHPQKDNFGRKLFLDVGLTSEIRFSTVALIIRPLYSVFQIDPKTPLNENEHHNLYGFGLQMGVRLWLW